MTPIRKTDLYSKLENKESFVLMVSGEHCPPCMKAKYELKNDNIFVIDANEIPEIIEQENIRGVPTFLIIKNGNIIDKFTGYIDRDWFLEKMGWY